MASNYNFYEAVDSFGRLIRVSKRFGKMREITMKKYDDDKIWIHLNDNSKCFTENKGFDISQSKYISMQYDDLLQLKNIIQELEPYKDKMIGESMMVCLFIQATLIFLTVNYLVHANL